MRSKIEFIIIFVLIGIIFIMNFDRIFNGLCTVQRKIIMDKSIKTVESYKCEENINSRIYYTNVDKEYIYMIQLAVDTYYPMILNDFSLEKNNKLTVILYPNEDELMRNLKGKLTSVPMGVYYGGVIHLLSPRCWTSTSNESEIKEIFLKQGPIVHEIVHYAVDMKTKGNFPVWFTEGTALYYEYKYTGFEWEKNLKEESEKITLKQLNEDFRYLDESLAYRKSFDVIKEIVDKYGEQKIEEICIDLSKGKVFN